MQQYQGYGQSPYGPQSYGQPQPQYDLEKKKRQGDDEETHQDIRCCDSKSGFARLDNWCIFLCCFGGLMCLISTFIPLWRVDDVGTTEISNIWLYTGFDRKLYGVIHVKGSWSQSWTTLAQSACDIRNLGQLTGLAAAGIKFVSGDEGCGGSESCQQGFSSSMHARCLEYQTMMRISMVTLSGTFLAFILIIAGTLITSMSKRRKSGGIAFGFYLFAGILLMIVNIVWAAVSDNSFKNLSLSAWYPYPSLGAGFYVHTAGYALVLIWDTIFGFIILPDVWAYDPAQEKLDKKKKKLEKRMQRDQQLAQKKQELQAIVNAQQQPMHPPPGYGQQPRPPPGYGQPAYPQLAPQPLGFSQGQQGVQFQGGQGGAQPAPSGGDFGLGGPGYDAGGQSPGGQTGFGLAPPAGYGAPQSPQAYGAPAPMGFGGEGGGSQSPSPWAAGPAQGYGAAPKNLPGGYKWPAHCGQDSDTPGPQWGPAPPAG